MLDLYEWIMQHRDKPLTAASFVFLAVLIFDRLGRRLITNQLKRLFHMDEKEEFQKFNTRQKRIESKIDFLLQKEGIEWQPVVMSDTKQGISVKKKRKPFKFRWAMSLLALTVVWSINYSRRSYRMLKNINRGVLVPLLAAISLFIKQVFGYEINEEYIDISANVILYIIMAIGIFMKPHKDGKTNEKFAQNVNYEPDGGE